MPFPFPWGNSGVRKATKELFEQETAALLTRAHAAQEAVFVRALRDDAPWQLTVKQEIGQLMAAPREARRHFGTQTEDAYIAVYNLLLRTIEGVETQEVATKKAKEEANRDT